MKKIVDLIDSAVAKYGRVQFCAAVGTISGVVAMMFSGVDIAIVTAILFAVACWWSTGVPEKVQEEDKVAPIKGTVKKSSLESMEL